MSLVPLQLFNLNLAFSQKKKKKDLNLAVSRFFSFFWKVKTTNNKFSDNTQCNTNNNSSFLEEKKKKKKSGNHFSSCSDHAQCSTNNNACWKEHPYLIP